MIEEKKPTVKKKAAPDVVAPAVSQNLSPEVSQSDASTAEEFGVSAPIAEGVDSTLPPVVSVESPDNPKPSAPPAVPSVTSPSESTESPSTVADAAGEGLSVADKYEPIDANAIEFSLPVGRPTLASSLPDIRRELWSECKRLNNGNLSLGSLLVQKFKSVDTELINLEKFLKAHGYE